MKYDPHHRHVRFTASVRVRLTLWYLLVIAGIICIFGGSFYATETWLNANVSDSHLTTQVEQETQRLEKIYLQALQSGAQPAAQQISLSAQEVVLVLRPDNSVLDNRGPLTQSTIQQLQTKSISTLSSLDIAITRDSSHSWHSSTMYRFQITPLLQRNERVATLIVGLPHAPPVEFWKIWLANGCAALLIAALGGYWLAGKALQPVKMITRTAREINATDLRRRLHLQRKDEFGELAATFDQMLARLEAAFERQTQFTADASHELRTPLTIIDLEINRALVQLEKPEEYRQVLQQIQAENEQMAAIVNSLLFLARADAGQMALQQQEVDLSDLVLASVERLLPLARQYQVKLATGDLPELLMRGDPHYLGQMLRNLLENGIKYTSGVGTQVYVELVCEQAGQGIVRVQDDGPGIAPEHLPSLFERFYRVDKARSRQRQQASSGPGGTGLGLAIARWIAEVHGGEIRVESRIGAGTLFAVYLPLRKTDEATDAQIK